MGREKGNDFSMAFRGYNTEEVDSYIESVNEKCHALELEKVGYAEKAAEARAKLDESNLKRGLAEKELADAQDEAKRIIAEAKKNAEAIITKARSDAEAIEAEAQKKAEATIGAAMFEEKKINERLEKNVVEKERIYNAFCDKLNEFKTRVFAEYAAQIKALEDIIANKVPESYGIPDETEKETPAKPEKPEIVREEVIEPVAASATDEDDEKLGKSLGIKISRESGRGEKVSSIMRELDEIKEKIAEKEKIKY